MGTERIGAGEARFLCAAILRGAGLSEARARVVAENLVEAELRGIPSHGLSRLAVYCERIQSGAIDANACLRVLREEGAALLLDAGHGPGQAMAREAMDLVVERAAEFGLCWASVRGGSHFGIAASYAMQSLRRGMIGIALTNAPPVMCPWGGREKLLGTNPFAVAIPAGRRAPIVLDCATSVVARGKVILCQREGRPIPEGWALDEEGRPTTDAARALLGSVLPMGGYKGAGMALVIDVLCALLSGADSAGRVGELYSAPETPQNLGFALAALNVAAFVDPGAFAARVDDLIDEIKASRRAPGCEEILVPGEIEARRAERYGREGIPIGAGVKADLCALARRYAPGARAEGLFSKGVEPTEERGLKR